LETDKHLKGLLKFLLYLFLRKIKFPAFVLTKIDREILTKIRTVYRMRWVLMGFSDFYLVIMFELKYLPAECAFFHGLVMLGDSK
jgi:hypothetical protein